VWEWLGNANEMVVIGLAFLCCIILAVVITCIEMGVRWLWGRRGGG